MRRALKRAFVAAGLLWLAVPGLLAEHISVWLTVGAAVLAGVIAAVVVTG